jgi:deazaflavin-dependent oxidoreductase (nitroreductase family)
MAREIKKPNAFQKLIHRILMSRPVSAFVAPRAHHLDQVVLKLTNGKYTISGILGWQIVNVTTIGAKSNQPRTMPLIGIVDNERIVIVASSFGREHNPGWYYNLKAHPECDVLFRSGSGKYMAHEVEGDEYERYWQMALTYYAGYEKYKKRAAHRHIPIMVLEPKK